jgi:hypothetical protein
VRGRSRRRAYESTNGPRVHEWPSSPRTALESTNGPRILDSDSGGGGGGGSGLDAAALRQRLSAARQSLRGGLPPGRPAVDASPPAQPHTDELSGVVCRALLSGVGQAPPAGRRSNHHGPSHGPATASSGSRGLSREKETPYISQGTNPPIPSLEWQRSHRDTAAAIDRRARRRGAGPTET